MVWHWFPNWGTDAIGGRQSEGGGRRAEGRGGQKTEDRGQKTEGGGYSASAVIHWPAP